MTVNLNLGYTRLILRVCDALGVAELPYRAYILATAYWETARTMEPVRETLADSDEKAIQRLKSAFAGGKLPWVKSDYWSGGYFGRGFVQLTHERNYKYAGDRLNVDLVSDPAKALDPDISAQIIVRGMMGGWFTGRALPDCVKNGSLDYVEARRVVNGTDRATEIAALAVAYEQAMIDEMAAKIEAVRPKARPKVEAPKVEPKAPVAPAQEAVTPPKPDPRDYWAEMAEISPERQDAAPPVAGWAGPVARVILRYGVGFALGQEAASALSGDPDVVLFVALAVGAAVEWAYTAAKRKGWAT